MRTFREWIHRFWGTLFPGRRDGDLEEELRLHVELAEEDARQRNPHAAESRFRSARIMVGGTSQAMEALRDQRSLRGLEDLMRDVRYAFRTMRRAPSFTAAAVVSIAMAVGANTAIFGLMDVLLLRPLPVHSPHQLVHVTTSGELGLAGSGMSNYPWFREVAARTDLFSDATLVRHDVFKVGIRGLVEPITGQRVGANYYGLLGVPAILGRTLVPADQQESGASSVAVISYGLWQRRFGGTPDAIGASITVDRVPYSIVGVTPPDFAGILVGWTMDVTMPLDPSEFRDPNNWFTMPLIARLKPGVDIEHVGVQLDPMLERLTATGLTDRFRRRNLERVAVESAARGISDLRQLFSRPLRLLMAAVCLLLLIACVNLAGLFVARNAARQHELGVRLALGAGPQRIAQQLLTESALLALLGAVPGILLAVRGSNLLFQFMPTYFGPVSIAVTADWRVLGFALFVTVTTTLLFGLIPAWQAARIEMSPSLNGTNPRTSTARVRVGRALVVAQFALSIVLVAGAGLFLRTLLNFSRIDTGFDRDRVVIVKMDPQGTVYEREQLRVFQREMLTALAELPGVRRVTLATTSPFNGNEDGKRLTVPGVAALDADDGVIQVNTIGPEYFDVFQVPILRGRPIDWRDQGDSQPVAVVSESFARRYFGDAGNAIGRQFMTGRGDTAITFEIVGVAADVRYQNLRTASDRLAYVPWFQAHGIRLAPFDFAISTEGNPANWINIVRAEIQARRPDAPILSISTMTQTIDSRLLSERLLATLGTFFAIVALTLAAVGVYGLFGYVVARRVPEIGVRLALGARPSEMMWMMLRENLVLAVIGSAVGIAAATAGLRVLEGLVFGLSSRDPVNIMSAALILMLVSLAAAFVPARRAASVDPLVALRRE